MRGVSLEITFTVPLIQTCLEILILVHSAGGNKALRDSLRSSWAKQSHNTRYYSYCTYSVQGYMLHHLVTVHTVTVQGYVLHHLVTVHTVTVQGYVLHHLVTVHTVYKDTCYTIELLNIRCTRIHTNNHIIQA